MGEGTFIGLDLGTYCGFALFYVSPGRGIASVYGTWDCSFRNGIDSPSIRLEKFERQLEDLISVGVTKAFYEIVRAHKGVQAGHVYGALKSKMMEVLERHHVPYEGLSVQEIKKHATGKGNASKAAMIEACRIWGFTVPDGADDTADGICIVKCGWETKT